jgi:hypothetical protein
MKIVKPFLLSKNPQWSRFASPVPASRFFVSIVFAYLLIFLQENQDWWDSDKDKSDKLLSNTELQVKQCFCFFVMIIGVNNHLQRYGQLSQRIYF